ncbi:Ank_2 domain-containing protein [Cephalotus follicularis]|uniref:Ank_2 domain-containing protein n=1 Tax=Cephalotus follicularis TaxID=3775 RepID=A0A1Q3CES3_CEPFO|nr:Ank_2 domain-containing protein [Cephalotus follicularis]
MSVPPLLNPKPPNLSLYLTTPHFCIISSPQTQKIPTKLRSLSLGNDDVDLDDHVIGDCLVFEEGVFEDPYLQNDNYNTTNSNSDNLLHSIKQEQQQKKLKGGKKVIPEIKAENLVPDKWREVQAEINFTKKERRKIAQALEFNSRVDKKKRGYLPLRNVNLEEYQAFREAKLAQLKPLVLDNVSTFKEEVRDDQVNDGSSERVAPKNPRWAVYGKGLEDVAQFLRNYKPADNKSQGPRKLFTQEEKVLLNRRIPDLALATCGKWQPLHTLAASGEFYLVDALLKHNVDINTVDKDGLTALHRAIICKKQAITNYLLRESANPFIRDENGATLMHYAVLTASSPTIKLLLLYNVDINLQDNDGWSPLHLAVQAGRTDAVRLLLIKGADKTLKNRDGLTPLDLCLYSGRSTRTYELIKLLKQLPKQR